MATRNTVTAIDGGTGEVSGSDDYVLPVVHTHLPRSLVNTGFWGALTGSVVLGVIDPPLGLLMGAGVLVARHRRHGSG
jgi:hypothetical protein